MKTIKQHRQLLRDLKKRIKDGDWSPPAHLSEPSKQLWAELVPERARSPERIAALRIAFEALDRLADIRHELAGVKLAGTTPKTGAQHLHPLLACEERTRKHFFKIWGSLDLDHRPSLDSPSMHDIMNVGSVDCGCVYEP